jgi:antitoxin (DNA-binding transcriptional repressor) of toxin-antitoxin stability system
MIEATATDMARAFHDYLGKAQRGQTILIRLRGKPVARLVPDSSFMPASKAAAIFRSYKATKLDVEAASAIEQNIRTLDREFDDALDN